MATVDEALDAQRDASDRLADLRVHLARDKVRFETSIAFTKDGSVEVILVSSRNHADVAWKRFSTSLFPMPDEGLIDVLMMLMNIREEVRES